MSLVQKNHSVVLSKVKRILMTGVSMGALCFITTPEPVVAQTLPQNINPVVSPVLSDLVNKGGVVTHRPPPVNGANGKDAHVKIGIPPKRVEATAGSNGGNGGSFVVGGGGQHSANGKNIFVAGSTGGAGGNGGSAGRLMKGDGAAGGNGGNGGNVSVNSTGNLSVNNGSGIVVFSNGGQGGKGGNGSALIDSIKSGAGGNGGNAGQVSVNNAGQLVVNGDQSFGIFAQAAGGHGGKAGDADGDVAKANATSSGHGGNGGTLSIDNTGNISTNGAGSDAVHGLSLGGNGADAAEAKSLTSSATNGVAGNAGDAGTVTITNNKSIETHGAQSNGLVGKSAGGKGGTGNNVMPGGSVDTATADGGHGGNGGKITVTNGSSVRTQGDASNGIIAASVGGAGGHGGWAVSVLDAASGDGGQGGNGAKVDFTSNSIVKTFGDKSAAVVVSSAGGNGGKGGRSVGGVVATSGAGGNAGHGGDVSATNKATIDTTGANSAGLLVTSSGGKGGNAGWSVAIGKTTSGNGGAGGNAGQINIVNHGAITTSGAGSVAIFAESLGGHGGDGGLAVGGLALGGSGGAGGNAADVTIENHAGLITTGDFSAAILAQSLGGKGGTAASGDLDETLTGIDGRNGGAGAVTVNNNGDILTLGTRSDAIAVLSQGGATAVVSVVNAGEIFTAGTQSAGIFAQSFGEESSGNISISNAGNVTVKGEGSGALVARSVVMLNDAPASAPLMNVLSADMLTFGTPDFTTFAANGAAGNVSINQTGNLIATGAGSSAIYAQSTGATNGNIDIVVQAESLLVGHSAGVTLIDGAENSLANHGTITGMGNTFGYIPGADGQLFAAGWIDGMAVVGTTGNAVVTNTGLMVGNIDLGSGRNTFTNAQDAWLVSGSLIGLGSQAGSDFINDGILTPGGSTMTQTTQVDGNLNQTANGRYLVGLDFAGSTPANDPMIARMVAAPQSSSASGSADRLNVSGSANLGGSMALSVANSGYAKIGRNDYVALRAEGGVNDDGMLLVAPNTAVATYTLEYTDKEIILGANIDYAARGLTENGISVGTTINANQTDQTSSAFRSLAEAIFAQPDIASLQRTYDLIDGEGTAGAQQAYFSDTNAFIGTVSQQTNLWSNPYRLGNAKADRNCTLKNNICVESLWRGWYSGFGSDTSLQGDPYVVGSGDLKSHSKGMAAGLDYELTKDLLLGFSVGMSKANFKVNDRLTQGDIETGRTAIYGVYRHNNLYIDGLFGVDWFNASTDRMAAILPTAGNAGFSDRLQNDFSGYGINARLETGYRMDLGGVQFSPFAALQLSSFHMNGSTESADVTGGDLALYYKSRTINSVPLSLGAQFDTRIELGENAYFSPYVRAAWVHEFSNKRSIEAGFTAAPGYEFVVHGAAQARNSAQVEAGFNVQIETGLSLYGKVSGNFSGSAHDVSGSGGLRLRW